MGWFHSAWAIFDRRDGLRLAGVIGTSLIGLGQLVAALLFRGRLGEVYNPLNHFVSELGETGVSAGALAFNAGLLLGGPILIVFMLGLGRRIGSIPGLIFGVAGVACGASGTAVGAAPMNDLLVHLFWARAFFNLGFAAMGIFTLIALIGRWGVPRRMALPGIGATVAFGAFLAIPQPLGNGGGDMLAAVTAMLNAPRPAVWMPAVLEWLAVLAVLGWALAVALMLPRRTA